MDACSLPTNVLVLGGTSEIALATLAELSLQQKGLRAALLGRDLTSLDAAVAQLEKLGVEAHAIMCDATDQELLDKALDDAAELLGDVDLCLLAFAKLGDQAIDGSDPTAARALCEVNFTAALGAFISCSERMKEQGHGTIAVFSSIAAVRVRAGNALYGAAKAGVDRYVQAVSPELKRFGVKTLLIRPGFVRTKMTAHLPDGPLATTANAVAQDVVRALSAGKDSVYSPRVLVLVAHVLRHLPRSVFQKMNG